MRIETIGNATLYLGDCLEILPTVAHDCAIVADPPYGIALHTGWKDKRSFASGGRIDHAPVDGDEKDFDPSHLMPFKEVLLWGADHYSARLPHGRWLAWNKLGDLKPWDDFSDVEFAWLNKRGSSKIYSHLWKGMCQAGAGVKRYHPTQKPVELMEWCLDFIESETVVDPYMGSGTTGVACARRGLAFVGIEKREPYFNIACERIENAQRQERLFA